MANHATPTTPDARRVRVERNRYGKPDQPWLVRCDYCLGASPFHLFSGLFGGGVKGWAPSWASAQDYAVNHAREHEACRCPTCHHIPTGGE